MSRLASRDRSVPGLTGRLSRNDLLWIANTAHGPAGHWHARVRPGDPDHDHLASPEAARRYLADHGVPVPDGMPDADALAELGIIRTMLQRRTTGAAHAEPWTDEGRALLATASYTLAADGRLTDASPGWRGFCRDLLLPLVSLIDEGAPLGRCSNPACRLVFQDASRNHARRWCDTAGCGNRDRVRRARRRTSARDAAMPGGQRRSLAIGAAPGD